jgi:hypothetical protein
MEFLITESQLKTLLSEEEKSRLGSSMKYLNEMVKQIVSRSRKAYGINLRILLTFGASVGGFVLPLDEFIRTQNFNITEDQRMLVLASIAFTLFFETRSASKKIISLIKEEGLEEIYRNGLRKGKELRSAFVNFVSSVNQSAANVLDSISYSFLIPIITDMISVGHETQDVESAAILITQRLIASGVVLVSSQALTELVKNILKRVG